MLLINDTDIMFKLYMKFTTSGILVTRFWYILRFADVDECERGLDNCSVNADCTNDIGSFSCACVQTYFGDGVTCSKLLESEASAQ